MQALVAQFVLLATVVAVAGTFLARAADAIAAVTGLGRMLIGSVLLAAATSLPELTVDVTAVRAGMADLAVGLGGHVRRHDPRRPDDLVAGARGLDRRSPAGSDRPCHRKHVWQQCVQHDPLRAAGRLPCRTAVHGSVACACGHRPRGDPGDGDRGARAALPWRATHPGHRARRCADAAGDQRWPPARLSTVVTYVLQTAC